MALLIRSRSNGTTVPSRLRTSFNREGPDFAVCFRALAVDTSDIVCGMNNLNNGRAETPPRIIEMMIILGGVIMTITPWTKNADQRSQRLSVDLPTIRMICLSAYVARGVVRLILTPEAPTLQMGITSEEYEGNTCGYLSPLTINYEAILLHNS